MNALGRFLGKLILSLLWLLMTGIVIVSALATVRMLIEPQNAMQQAATAAVGLFGVVTPYVFMRMLEIGGRIRDDE